MAQRAHDVARLAADVAWQPHDRRVAEAATAGHESQHSLVLQREVRDVFRRRSRGIPTGDGLAQPAHRHGQPLREPAGIAGEGGVGSRQHVARLRACRRLRLAISVALAREGDRESGKRAEGEQDDERLLQVTAGQTRSSLVVRPYRTGH